jgi:hypothetical protein
VPYGGVIAALGDGTVVNNADSPFFPPPPITNAVGVAAADGAFYVLTSEGTVIAWGRHRSGPLPPGLTNVTAVAAAEYGGLALKSDGSVIAIDGFPMPPPDLTNAVALAGFDSSGQVGIATRTDGTITEWGSLWGGQTNVPMPVLTNAVGVAAGFGFLLALRRDGTVAAWGNDDNRQCDTPFDLPVAKAVAGGLRCSLALVDPSQPATPPAVVGQPSPRSQTVGIGSTARFTVRAIGYPPLSYQWFFGTNAIPSATNSVLTLPNVHSTNSGSYTVVVSNPRGPTTSQPGVLSVLPALNVNMVPAISLFGEIGLTYRLDYLNAVGPTNNWQATVTLTLTNCPQLYFDTAAIGQPQRFYRLVQVTGP